MAASNGLYRWIGDNVPPLAFTKGIKRQNDGSCKTAIKWTWKEFDHHARKDGLRLSHWDKSDNTVSTGTSAFGKYNVSTNIYSYSSEEYLSHLRDESGEWSKDETDYLFSLCHAYDLRWFVIKDRWEWPSEYLKQQEQENDLTQSAQNDIQIHERQPEVLEPEKDVPDTLASVPAALEGTHGLENSQITPTVGTRNGLQTSGTLNAPKSKERSLEEMKDRYYSVCRRLIRARPASDESAKMALLHSYAYEKDRETLRKKHIKEHIMTLNPAQLAEEEFLYIESRRLEQTYSRTAREREELWRLLGGVGPQSSSAMAMTSPFLSQQAQANAAAAAGLNNKKRRRGELDMLEQSTGGPEKIGSAPTLTTAQDEQYCITRYDTLSTPSSTITRPSGVYLRSSKPPALKTSLAPRIQASLAEGGISMRLAMPTRSNMEKLDALVGAITSLLDCKKQVERAEYEVKILKTRKDASMRVDEEDRRRAQLELEEIQQRDRKEREASGISLGALSPPGDGSSATSSGMQVDG